MPLIVEYKKQLTLTQVVSEISKLSSPHILLWYIGIYGLKKKGVEFYKNSLISPILKVQNQSIFWLVDLTAWGALKNPEVKITTVSSFVEKIENFNIECIKCITSAYVFEKMQTIDDKLIIEYFKNALHRDFIHVASKHVPDSKITVQQLFENHCPIVSEWYHKDASKCYSTLQYLEGCLLVDEIIQQSLKAKPGQDIQIVFALPNNEFEYYWDETNAFQQDLEFLINRRFSAYFSNTVIRIIFLAFKYSDIDHHRPYNIPGKNCKKNEFLCDDVIGSQMKIKGEGKW